MTKFENLNNVEKRNYLAIAEVTFGLTFRKLKKDFIKPLADYWEKQGQFFDVLDLLHLKETYSGENVWCVIDNQERNEWVILEDNNYIIPNECFEENP